MTEVDYKRLRGRVAAKISLVAVMLGLILFVSAGSIRYWEAWAYCGVLFIPMICVSAYLLKKSPRALERRMKTREREGSQKLIVKLLSAVFFAAWIIPGLDHRFGWSDVPATTVIAADAMVFLGYLLFFAVLKENEYASRIVEVEEDQKVISSGPYALIRHPMYLATLIMYLFSPLALGSWFALLAFIPLSVLFIFRIIEEEGVLKRDLPGYDEYMQKVKYKLIPLVW